MGFESFQAFYLSNAQAVIAPVVAPLGFLGWLAWRRAGPSAGISPLLAPFVRRYCVAFAVLTVVDPLVTGPGMRALGWADGSRGLAVVIAFVLLGDFRVLWLVLRLTGRRTGRDSALEAVGWTLVVPALTVAVRGALEHSLGGLPPQAVWLIYEVGFAGLALLLRERILPARVPVEGGAVVAYARAVAGYACVYYALWAASDVLILALDLDAGWLLRVAPNQLYYAFYVPFVFWRFFSRSYQDTSSSVQAAR